MKAAFSSIAFPGWTLEQIAEYAGRLEYDGVELRSFGFGSTDLPSDPTLTSPAKIEQMFERAGTRVCCIASGASFDRPVKPPIVGLAFGDYEQPVREARRLVDLASNIEAPMVRVYGFKMHGRESRKTAIRRIAKRLAMVVDHSRNRGVRVVLENGGSFETAEQMAELIEQANVDNLLGAAYSIAVGQQRDEDIAKVLDVLGDRLLSVKIRDHVDGQPCVAGQGQLDVTGTLQTLANRGFGGWVVFEYDRLWHPELPDAEEALSGGPRLVVSAQGRELGARRRRVAAAMPSMA